MFAHFSNLSGVVTTKGTLVPDKTHHHSLPGNCGNESVEQEQHGSVVVKSFDKQPLTLFLLHDVLHVEVNVVTLMHSSNELVDFNIILVNRLEQVVESLNYFQVRFLELFIDVDQINVPLNLFITHVLEVLIQQVAHVE